MVGDVGRLLVFFALGCALLSAVGFGMGGRQPKLLKAAGWGLYAATGATVVAFAIVILLTVKEQYQYEYIFGHSKREYELQYKVAGAWAGQEGSILLWTVCSAIFSIFGFRAAGPYRRWFGLTAGVITGILAGILAFESPFALIPALEGRLVMPPDGRGLQNSLLNYWMVIHPPTIFLGFGSLTTLFCFGMAGMLSRDLEGWMVRARPWALVSLGILGLGLCMGGFWAYETLGWGGFWMWDPVENTSFVPWCAVAALVHGIFIQAARKKGHMMNLALAGAPFILFCYGTFMTRSGFLGDTSVHSFAEMDSKALWFLISMLVVSVFGYTGIWIGTWRHRSRTEVKPIEQSIWNKTFFYQAAIWLLFGFGLCTAIGMSVPLLQSAWINTPFLQSRWPQEQKVVEERTYHEILFLLYVPIMLGISIAPFATWRGLKGRELFAKFVNPLALAVFLTGMLLLASKWGWLGHAFDATDEQSVVALGIGRLHLGTVSKLPWTAFLAFLTFFALSANLFKLAEFARRSPRGIGGFLTHIGLATALAGLIVSRGLEQRKTVSFQLQESAVALGQTYRFAGNTLSLTNRNNRVKLDVTGPGGNYQTTPGLYFQMGQDGKPVETIWPGIKHSLLNDMYVNLHPPTEENVAVTDEVHLQKGQEAKFENMLITYLGLRTEGELGTAGAKFFADVQIEEVGQTESIMLTQVADDKATRLGGTLTDGRKVDLVSMDAENGGGVIKVSGVDKPITVAAGQRQRAGGLVISCLGLRSDSSHDTPMVVMDLQVQPIVKTFTVVPEVGIGEEGLVNTPAIVNDTYSLTFRPEAADRSAFLTFQYRQPPFVLDVYYKPLVMLVWVGVGIMTLGGFISAFYRRISKKGSSKESEGSEDDRRENDDPSSESPATV